MKSSGASKYSNDPSVGWVSIQEIKNLWIEFGRELDVSVMPRDRPVSRDDVLKLFDTLQHRLYRRAAANFESFLPDHRRAMSVEPAAESAKATYEQHKAAIRARTTG